MSRLVDKFKKMTLPDIVRGLKATANRPALGMGSDPVQMKQKVELLAGDVGSGLDQALTLRDLIELGAIKIADRLGNVYNPDVNTGGIQVLGGSVGVGNGSGGSTNPGGGGPAPDLTPPPAPTGLAATGAFAVVILEWDNPTLFYANYGFTEIFRAETDNLGVAVKIGQSGGFLYADTTGRAGTFYYWIRFISKAGVSGNFQGVAGVPGSLGLNPDYVLNVLQGQITEQELFSTLGGRIDLIDGAGAGSVNARIQTEATQRSNADSALASQITTVQAAVDDNTVAIQTETTARANADGQLFAQYTVKIDAGGKVAGFGLASTANNTGSSSSEFAIRADRFSISAPFGVDGIVDAVPFVVQATQTTINGVSVPAGTYIADAYIRNGTITNAKIGNAAIDTAKIADASIVTAKIGDAEITTAKIGDAQISTAKIQDAAITTALIGDAAIGTAKIADAAIETAKISNLAVTAAKIADATITSAKIGDAEITSAKIADAAITSAKIGDAQITSAKIGDGEVTNAKIGNVIQSSNFVPGSTGWQILKNGNAEFNGVVTSRNLTVASGTFHSGYRTVPATTYQVYDQNVNDGSGGFVTVSDPGRQFEGRAYYLAASYTIDTGYNYNPWDTENLALIAHCSVAPGSVLAYATNGNFGTDVLRFIFEVKTNATQWSWNGQSKFYFTVDVYVYWDGQVIAYDITQGVKWKLYKVT